MVLLVLPLVVGCGNGKGKDVRKSVTVSIPAVAYFVDRLSGGEVKSVVMIPQSVGHSNYTPRPSQLMEMSESELYLALGYLDFEMAWKEKMTSVASGMRWADISDGVDIVEGVCCAHSEDESHVHGTDPHYWMSPKQVKTMVGNIVKELKTIIPKSGNRIDSAYNILIAEVEQMDRRVNILSEDGSKEFMIYHPSLTYLARDYDMVQLSIEKGGNMPTMKGLMKEISQAKERGVKVVFVQQGYDIQKAEEVAKELSAEVVEIAPESYEWEGTMETIIKALER